MEKQFNKVKEFNKAFNQETPFEPTNLQATEINLRYKLQLEELNEYKEAAFNGDIVETLDALVDQMYILIGTILKHGLQDKFEEAFDLVHQNNMNKLGADGKPIYREDGKIIKPEGFTPVDLNQLF
jgi:predicted HAD superfamily Cof-like phosphohydrolase